MKFVLIFLYVELRDATKKFILIFSDASPDMANCFNKGSGRLRKRESHPLHECEMPHKETRFRPVLGRETSHINHPVHN